MVYGVCRLILRDPIDAEDAAQQTFLSAYRGLLAGQEPRDPSAWLGTIARNECRSRLRARQTEPLAPGDRAVSGDETAARGRPPRRGRGALRGARRASAAAARRDPPARVLRASPTPRWPRRSALRAPRSSRCSSGAGGACRSSFGRCASALGVADPATRRCGTPSPSPSRGFGGAARRRARRRPRFCEAELDASRGQAGRDDARSRHSAGVAVEQRANHHPARSAPSRDCRRKAEAARRRELVLLAPLGPPRWCRSPSRL